MKSLDKGSIDVYLDSQDFSRFSKLNSSHKEYSEIKSDLLSLKKTGHARFIFSDMHIFECFPKSIDARKFGLDRIKIISEFCDSYCRPSTIETIISELRAMVADQGDNANIQWNHWFPDIDASVFDQIIAPHNVLSTLQAPLNRAQRRAERTTRRAARTALSESVHKLFPFRARDREMVLSHLDGSHRLPSLKPIIFAGLDDIVGLAKWLVGNWKHGEALTEIIRGPGSSLLLAMQTFKEEMERSIADIRKENREADIQSILNRVRSDIEPAILREMPARMAGSILEVDVTGRDLQFSATLTPSLRALISFMREVVWRSAAPAQARKPLSSDFADALHVVSFPHVHLFRCDRFTAGALAKIYPEHASRLVGDISSLPDRIRALHQEQT